ncbi:MAG: (d)CMP kinase [Bacteroidales bacterium]|nr:(d)CMP kinase [Bacteroidales bacterium]MDY3783380.1 (d)CMP kinase [Candidatus Cryptobacteroides sp.]
MTVPDITIAIDGYSSTGKSSFAKLLARRFSFQYLDSGAYYRGVTLYAQQNGLISEDNTVSDALEAALADGTLQIVTDGDAIRSMKVSSQVSPIAALPYVRSFVDRRLHSDAASGRVVMDGRDIGTTVFPNAELKLFMVASDEVRARRRYNELLAKGQTPVFEEVLANLRERDYIDSHREASPLTQAPDAFVLDNSSMTLEEELIWVEGLIRGKFGILE